MPNNPDADGSGNLARFYDDKGLLSALSRTAITPLTDFARTAANPAARRPLAGRAIGRAVRYPRAATRHTLPGRAVGSVGRELLVGPMMAVAFVLFMG